MGAAIDRVGLRAVLNLVSATLIVLVHLALTYTTSVPPVVPLLFLGICYSIYASALWPSIALVTEPKYHATAYGVVTAVQNLGLAVVPLGVGLLMPSASTCPTYADCVRGYENCERLLIGFGSVGILASVALNVADYSSRIPVLNWSEARVQAARDEGKGESLLSTDSDDAYANST
jgi:MFS family permease